MADEKFIKELQDIAKAGAGTNKGSFAANPAQEKQMYDQFMQQLKTSLVSDPGVDKPGVQSSVRNMMTMFPQQRHEIATFVLEKIKNPDVSAALAQRTPNTTAPPVHTPPPRPRSDVNVMDAARSGNPANPTPEARAASQRFQAGLSEAEVTQKLQAEIRKATPQVQAQANRILESLKNTSDDRIDGAALAAIDKIGNPSGANKEAAERNLSQATNSIMTAWKQDPAKVEQSLRQQMQTGSPSVSERAGKILDALKTGGAQTETKLRDALKIDSADVSASEVRTLAKATLLERMQSALSPSAMAESLSKIDTTTMIQGAMDRYTQRYNNQLLSFDGQAAVAASQKASYDEAARIARDAIIQSSGEEGFKKACDSNNGKNPVLTQACAIKP